MLRDALLLRVPLAALLGALGCSGTGQPEVSYPAFADVAAPGEITAGAWKVTLEEASVAFGPVYFCASASGSATLCNTAIGELTEITAVDALDAAPQALGTVRGFTGSIRSASYDFGVHWFLTESSATAAPVAPGGHSAHFAGSAVKGSATVRFVADVDVIAQFKGQRAVPSAAAQATITGDGERLGVSFDAGAWIAKVDFDEALTEMKDPYVIAPGSRNYGAIVIAMTAQATPGFAWTNAR